MNLEYRADNYSHRRRWGLPRCVCVEREEDKRQSLKKYPSLRCKSVRQANKEDCAFVTKVVGKQRVLTMGWQERRTLPNEEVGND